MDWLSDLADWANANEGVIAMLGGLGALLIAGLRQRGAAAQRREAQDPLPAKVVIRPVSEERVAGLISVLVGYGGRAARDAETLTAEFPDADDAARAGLGVQQALSHGDQPKMEILICERSAHAPESSEANQGSVRTTGRIRKALLDAPDLRVKPGEVGALPFLIEAAPARSDDGPFQFWALCSSRSERSGCFPAPHQSRD